MKTREAIIEGMRHQVAEIEQLFNDAAYWNSLHPTEEPIDPDPDGTLTRFREAFTRAIAAETSR